MTNLLPLYGRTKKNQLILIIFFPFSALSHSLGDFVSDCYGYHEFAT